MCFYFVFTIIAQNIFHEEMRSDNKICSCCNAAVVPALCRQVVLLYDVRCFTYWIGCIHFMRNMISTWQYSYSHSIICETAVVIKIKQCIGTASLFQWICVFLFLHKLRKCWKLIYSISVYFDDIKCNTLKTILKLVVD